MKIGIVVTTHYSENLRPNGNELIQNYCQSAQCINYPFTVYVYDNASTKKLNGINYPYVKVIRVEDQTLRGLSGTWNDGIQLAIKDNCDLIIISNDDIILNNSVNTFIKNIYNHEYNNISMYGPVSNGILCGIQLQPKPVNNIIELTGNLHSNMLNGFFFGFMKNFYYNFKMLNGNLIDEVNFPWGGNEEELQPRIWKQGGRSFVIGHCHLFHHKIRGWKQHM
jgi:hypothetical protein